MTKVDPQWYYTAASKLAEASKSLEQDLKNLDGQLNVARSAGTYATGGPKWGASYDQSASDVFEVGSLGAMAASHLAELIHQGGLNHARSDNASNPGGPQEPTPAPPQGTLMASSMHPTQMAVGGDRSKPSHWDLIEKYVTKEWADCDEGRIKSAGTNFDKYGTSRQNAAMSLWNDVTAVFTDDRQKGDTEIYNMVTEVANVCGALNSSGEQAQALAVTCGAVGAKADEMKKLCKQSLTVLNGIVISYELDKLGASRLPGGEALAEAIDQIEEKTKKEFAKANDNCMQAINDLVDQAAQSNTGIYNLATTDAQFLSSILDRTPRQTNPIRNRTSDQNWEAGKEGERRAGIDPNAKKREVTVKVGGKEVTVVPDRMDDENRQVTEVKDTNEIRPSRDQILAEAEWAKQNGYTMTLVVDHRTQINDPQIQAMINSGQIELTRKELDDGFHY
ncbi:putative toxin [Mycobacteroides franklinii]|uniref:putative toxin n=1 Tax=Mycobacteroides franklinii TaxID=948102 RepID=UPI0009929BB6|nr:putative toxin [Mycobacteroides franklinii]